MKNKLAQKITPFLWFNDNAEEAANLYTSLFADSKIRAITRYRGTGPGPQGSVMTVKFQLEGQEFVALNGGPHFTFTEAVSFVVNCDTQEETSLRRGSPGSAMPMDRAIGCRYLPCRRDSAFRSRRRALRPRSKTSG